MLTELNHATALGNTSTGNHPAQASRFESLEAPFDCVYCVPARARTTDSQGADAVDTLAKYLALESTPEARAAIRSCRASQTPREQSRGRSLTLKKLGYASLADRKHEFISELAAELVDAIQQHWLTKDSSADWEQLVRGEQQAASVPKLAAATDGEPAAPPVVVPVNDATSLALRGRFKEQMSLEFASEVLLAIQRHLDARDDRGRPFILARDAKQIADTARAVVASFAERVKHDSGGGARFVGSPVLRPLIAAGSQRVLRHAVEKFDPKQPERFLPVEAIDELLYVGCRALLEESLAQPDLAAAITALIELDQATARTIDHATTDLLQCGCDRRTLLVVPKDQSQSAAAEKLLSARPLAAVVTAEVGDVLLVSEEAGIAPRSLALGLERVFPGIADAARRLLTRIDVEWKSLV